MRKVNQRLKKVQLPFEFHYRDHDGFHKRVWRNDWHGDQFEIMGPDHFAMLQHYTSIFAIPFIDKTDDED